MLFQEAEQKKKQAEEEDKAKDAEFQPTKELSNNEELEEVKIRLGALEDAVKEIVVEKEKRKGIDGELNNNRRARDEAVQPTADKSYENQNRAKDLGGSSMNITQNNAIQRKDAVDIAATLSKGAKK